MSSLTIIQTKDALSVIDAYPKHVRDKLYALRQLILDSADEIEGLYALEETLKWGEPSYIAKKGSTIRIDWKPKKPEQYAIYFKCTSKLVETFRAVYGDLFQYENNRAILFTFNDSVPVAPLKKCIKATLQYHKVKTLDKLGIDE